MSRLRPLEPSHLHDPCLLHVRFPRSIFGPLSPCIQKTYLFSDKLTRVDIFSLNFHAVYHELSTGYPLESTRLKFFHFSYYFARQKRNFVVLCFCQLGMASLCLQLPLPCLRASWFFSSLAPRLLPASQAPLTPLLATHPRNRPLSPIIATLPKLAPASPLFATHPRPPGGACRFLPCRSPLVTRHKTLAQPLRTLPARPAALPLP